MREGRGLGTRLWFGPIHSELLAAVSSICVSKVYVDNLVNLVVTPCTEVKQQSTPNSLIPSLHSATAVCGMETGKLAIQVQKFALLVIH